MEDVLAASFLDELPARLIGDKAYDSVPLDEKLATQYGIELIAPNRRGRKQKTQDDRQLRRYRKRWKVERLFAVEPRFQENVKEIRTAPFRTFHPFVIVVPDGGPRGHSLIGGDELREVSQYRFERFVCDGIRRSWNGLRRRHSYA